jgi:hypothetical protein
MPTKDILTERFVTEEGMAGKTIKKVSSFNDEVIILFVDGTYTRVALDSDDENLELAPMDPYYGGAAVTSGVISQAEWGAILEEHKSEREEMKRRHDQEQIEVLRARLDQLLAKQAQTGSGA